jgi:hypothetical protein
VKARRGIGLPAPQFEPQTVRSGDATIESLKYRWQGLALGLDITRGRDYLAGLGHNRK